MRRDIFDCEGPEPIETTLFLNTFDDTDDAASFVDSYRKRIARGMEPQKALSDISEIYGLEPDQLTSLLSGDQSQEPPSS